MYVLKTIENLESMNWTVIHQLIQNLGATRCLESCYKKRHTFESSPSSEASHRESHRVILTSFDPGQPWRGHAWTKHENTTEGEVTMSWRPKIIKF